GAFACQFVNSLLQLRYHLRVLLSQIGLFTGILRDVVELQSGGQRRAPDQFPVAFAHAAAKWFNVVNDLVTRRRLAVAQGGPDVDAIERLSFVQTRATKTRDPP